MRSLEWIPCKQINCLYAESEAFSRYWIHDSGTGIVLEFMTCNSKESNWVILGDHFKNVAAAKGCATRKERKQ